MIIDNAFFVLFYPPKYMKSHLRQPKISKFSRDHAPDPPRLACPLPGSRLSWFIDHLWKHRSRDCTMAASLNCTARISLLRRIVHSYDRLIKALNKLYTSKGEYACEKMGEGKITKFINIYEEDYVNKITFKGESARCYCLEPKIPQIPSAPPPPNPGDK